MKKIFGKVFGFAVIMLLISIVLTGCANFFDNGVVRGFSGNQYGTGMKARFDYFDGNRGARFPLKQNDTISIKYDLACEEGTLTLTFEDSAGTVFFTNSAAAGTELGTATALKLVAPEGASGLASSDEDGADPGIAPLRADAPEYASEHEGNRGIAPLTADASEETEKKDTI